MNRDFYIYVLFRLDGRPFYLGKGRRNRWLYHEQHAVAGGSHKDNVIVQIHRQGKEVPKVKIRQGLTNAEAKELEILFISVIGRRPNGPLLNQTAGGDGCVEPSEETKKRISAKLKGQILSAETRNKMSIARSGTKLDPEVYKRAGQTNKARGHKRTDEAKAKMRAAKLGRVMPMEQREKISASMRGKRPYEMTEATRQKMSESASKRRKFK